jgi:nitrous oxide reductase accessory protein NosL
MRPGILIAILLLMFTTSGFAAQTSPPKAPERPAKEDKCPVCGMFVYKYPDWVAATVLSTGEALYFDGAKDMFRYIKQHVNSNGRIASAWVTEYYGLRMIDAKKAFYVVGSDIYGPMGHELVPFATRQEAEEFMADHKGRRILRYDEVDGELLKGLK